MTTHEQSALVREVRIDAPRELVYEFFVDGEKLLRWMGTRAEIDPRPGGIFRVDVDGEHVAIGEYVELAPGERVVLTWGWEGGEVVPPGSSTVEVTLTADGDGTLLRLRHELPAASIGAHGDGWDHYLARLAISGTGKDPGPDPWVKSAT